MCVQELFDFIAVALEKFVAEHPENKNETPEKELGFIVSYPVNQAVLSLGTAIKWNIFSADDTVEFIFPFFCFYIWIVHEYFKLKICCMIKILNIIFFLRCIYICIYESWYWKWTINHI